jgi:hypothetical protein
MKGKLAINLNPASRDIGAVIVLMVLSAVLPSSAGAGAAIGPRVGYDFDTDNLVLGAEAELGRVFQSFRFAPSLDFELGDNSVTVLNSDFRLYLFNLPETGLHFYGSVGPTVVLDNQTEIGLSLVAGMKIPMKRENRYNLELRFGIGDIPDLKLMLGILFGI